MNGIGAVDSGPLDCSLHLCRNSLWSLPNNNVPKQLYTGKVRYTACSSVRVHRYNTTGSLAQVRVLDVFHMPQLLNKCSHILCGADAKFR